MGYTRSELYSVLQDYYDKSGVFFSVDIQTNFRDIT